MQTFKTSKAKENILGRIRKSLGEEKLPMPFPDAEKQSAKVYSAIGVSAEEEFVSVFKSLGGKFVFCDNEQELLSTLTIMYENLGWKQMLCADERLLKLFHNNNIDIVKGLQDIHEGEGAGLAEIACTMVHVFTCFIGAMIQDGIKSKTKNKMFRSLDEIIADINSKSTSYTLAHAYSGSMARYLYIRIDLGRPNQSLTL